MSIAFEIARALTGVAFLGYGVHCILSPHMAAEFRRYGLAGLHPLVGGLEIAGALGLFGSYLVPALGVVAAGGLCVLMALGVGTRIRIRDPLPAMLPALFFCGLSAYLFVAAW